MPPPMSYAPRHATAYVVAFAADMMRDDADAMLPLLMLQRALMLFSLDFSLMSPFRRHYYYVFSRALIRRRHHCHACYRTLRH